MFCVNEAMIGLNDNESHLDPFLLHPSAMELLLEKCLGRILSKPLHLEEKHLDITVVYPNEAEIVFAWKANQTIYATLEIRLKNYAEMLRIRFPYPAYGVFIIRSESSGDGRAGKWVWHPRLVGMPGLWLLRKHAFSKGKHVTTDFLRLVFSGGRFLNYSLTDENNTIRLPSVAILPKMYDGMRCGDSSGGINVGLIAEDHFFINKKNRTKLCKNLYVGLSKVAAQIKSSGIEALDEQDIRWQRLLTYSAYLIDWILEWFVVLTSKSVPLPEPPKFWKSLCDIADRTTLIPLPDLIQSGRLHFFSPINGIDALSQLTSFQRYDWGRKIIERLPAVFRQNHISYQGGICPIEAPESKKVGLTLHLASRVRSGILGELKPPARESKDSGLGHAASLVPFYQHNDSPRTMMGAKNLNQAVPIKGWTDPVVGTGHEKEVSDRIRSLVDMKMIPENAANVPGADLLIAYMPWYGLNMEDAIVANKRLVDEGVFDWEMKKEGFKYIMPGFNLTKPIFENSFEEAFKILQYEENNLRKPGWIKPQNPLAFFKSPEGDEVIPLLYEDEDDGELIEIKYCQPPSSLLGGSLSWTIKRRFPLMVGDKLMGRYGNKGVVSAILHADELPRLPDDERLPQELRGRPIDLILNPHGVISRMNLGQLLETSIGLERRLRSDSGHPAEIGKAFADMDLDRLRDSFRTINAGSGKQVIDEYGRMFLTLPGGDRTHAPVTIGFQHIVRLKHVAAVKAQVRGWPRPKSQYRYHAVTGQPVGGRRRKGGQRLGEMEIWALAAHGATHNLQSVLGIKSDPAKESGKLPYGQTFQAIRDHLFAMGIDLQVDREETARLAWASKKTIEKRGKELRDSDTWTIGVEGEFGCSNPNCTYKYPGRLQATGRSERSQDIRLTVRDVLQALGFQLVTSGSAKIPPVPAGQKEINGQINASLAPISPKKKKKYILVNYTRKRRTVRISVTIGKGKRNKVEFTAYRQNDQADKSIPLAVTTEFWLTCPDHTTGYLICQKQLIVPVASAGGLCDPAIFGNVSVNDWNPETSWGYIRLPKPIAYPRARAKPGDGSPLRFLKSDNPPDLECIPVLPLKYRYRGLAQTAGSIISQHDPLTRKYRELAELTGQNADPKKIRMVIKALFELLHGRLFGKHGLIRRAGLGRRVDSSGRLVIVPDPRLDWDACGVPTEVLIELLGPHIAKHPHLFMEFVNDEAVDKLIKAIFAVDFSMSDIKEETKQFVLTESFWTGVTWPSKTLSDEHIRLAQRVLERFLEEYPETTVLLNRQPSLHRYSIMGFRPVPLSPDDGMVLKINPLVCKGFGADFDGDEMTIHIPLSEEEQTEAEAMKPTKPWNLISWANGEPLANFDQDFVAGHFFLNKAKLAEILPSTCADCRAILAEPTPWHDSHGQRLLKHLSIKHPLDAPKIVPRWMRLAFEAVTRQGLSFGFLELAAVRDGLKKQTEIILDELCVEPDERSLSAYTEKIGKHVLEKLKDIVGKPTDTPGHGFAALAVSGARGGKQTRQIVGARGLLSPGNTGFTCKPIDFFVQESLVAGMRRSSSFMAAMNGRSSMIDKKLGTGKAGDLTRRLVLAGWDWVVKQGDCGVTGRLSPNLTNCAWRKRCRICSACYGPIPGLSRIPDGFPAGLLAAQFFGERGTQLSMQSFHTAERQLSIDDVVSLLSGRDPSPMDERRAPGYNWFTTREDVDGFVERVKAVNAYKGLDVRHLRLIWLIIHLSQKHTLASAWQGSRSALSGLIGPRQWFWLLEAIRKGVVDDLSSPITRVMTGRVPVSSLGWLSEGHRGNKQ